MTNGHLLRYSMTENRIKMKVLQSNHRVLPYTFPTFPQLLIDWLIDGLIYFCGISTCQGLFYTERLGKCIHCNNRNEEIFYTLQSCKIALIKYSHLFCSNLNDWLTALLVGAKNMSIASLQMSNTVPQHMLWIWY